MGCAAINGIADISSSYHTQNKLKAHTAKGYLISCMDFRLLEDVVKFMNKQGYNINYDQFILAGSSLGLTQDKFPHWGKTLLEHMSIGENLHHFSQIIIIDHLDCGAYKKFYPELSSPEEEIQKHIHHMKLARQIFTEAFPNMKFKSFLMTLHGDCNQLELDEKILHSGRYAIENTDQFTNKNTGRLTDKFSGRLMDQNPARHINHRASHFQNQYTSSQPYPRKILDQVSPLNNCSDEEINNRLQTLRLFR